MKISKIVILLLANSTLGYTSGDFYNKYTPCNYYNYQIYNNMTMQSNNLYRNVYRNKNKKSDRSNNKQKIEKEFISLDSIKNKTNDNEQRTEKESITLDNLNNKTNDNKYYNSQIKSDKSNNKQKIEKEFISLDSIKNKINSNEQIESDRFNNNKMNEEESITLDNFNNENIITNDDNLEATYLNITPRKYNNIKQNNLDLSNSKIKEHAYQDSIFKKNSIELLQTPEKETIRLPNFVKGQNEKYIVYTKNNKLPILTEKVSQDSKTITLNKENITENKMDQFNTSEIKVHNTLEKFKDLTKTIMNSYSNRKETDTKEIIIYNTLKYYGTKKINEITDGFNEYNNDKLSSNNMKNLLLPLLRMAVVVYTNKDNDDRKLLNETTNSIKCDKEKNKLSNEVKQTIIKNNNNEDKVSNKIIDNNEEEILNKEVPISNNNKQLLDDKISIMNKIDEEQEINETNSDINYLINTLETIKKEIDTYEFIGYSLNHMDTKGHLNNDNKNMFKYKINTLIADYYSVNGGLENHCFDDFMKSNIDYGKCSNTINDLIKAKNNYFIIQSILKTIERALDDTTEYNPSIDFKYLYKNNNEFDLEIKLNNQYTNNKNILIFGFNTKKKEYFVRTMFNNIKEQIVKYEEKEIKNNKTFSSRINESKKKITELKDKAYRNKKEICKLLGIEEGEILKKNKVSIYGVTIEASGDKLFISSKEEDNNNYNRNEYNGKKRKRNNYTNKSNSSSESNSHEKYDSHK